MKNQFVNLAFICLLALSAGCKKKTDIDFRPESSNTLTSNSSKGDLGAILKNAARKPEVFTVNATTGGEFTSSKGITYTIDPGIFIKPNGQTAEGNVNVAVSEITKASEMILNDMPTNAIINPADSTREDSIKNPKLKEEGGMLNSFGEIKVEAKQNEEKLELKPGADIKVEIPQAAVPEPIDPLVSVPVWNTRPIKYQELIGYNIENQKVFMQSITDEREQIGVEWVKTPQVCQQNTNAGTPSLFFNIPKLTVWVNTDVLIRFTRTTTVLGYFTNEFNDDADNSDHYVGEQANMLFFKKKGDNTLVKLYDHIIQAPNGKKGFLSYQETFGIGMEGTFLALVNKNGKFYAEKKAVTIGEPTSGKNYFGVNFTLSEVTENQMLSLIESMNNE